MLPAMDAAGQRNPAAWLLRLHLQLRVRPVYTCRRLDVSAMFRDMTPPHWAGDGIRFAAATMRIVRPAAYLLESTVALGQPLGTYTLIC